MWRGMRIRDIGYEQEGFHWQRAQIDCFIHPQSTTSPQWRRRRGNKDEGAGDQGMSVRPMPVPRPRVLMPAPIFYAHRNSCAPWRKPAIPARAPCSAPPTPRARSRCNMSRGKAGRGGGGCWSRRSTNPRSEHSPREVREDRAAACLVNVLPEGWMCDEAQFYINPTRHGFV